MKITSIDPQAIDRRAVLAAHDFLAAGYEEICRRSRAASDIVFAGTIDDILNGVPAVRERKRAAFDQLTYLCDQRFGAQVTNQALVDMGCDHWQTLRMCTANVATRLAAT